MEVVERLEDEFKVVELVLSNLQGLLDRQQLQSAPSAPDVPVQDYLDFLLYMATNGRVFQWDQVLGWCTAQFILLFLQPWG